MKHLNEDKHWSEMDLFDLTSGFEYHLQKGLDHDASIKEVAHFLIRGEDECREKLEELGLIPESPTSR